MVPFFLMFIPFFRSLVLMFNLLNDIIIVLVFAQKDFCLLT